MFIVRILCEVKALFLPFLLVLGMEHEHSGLCSKDFYWTEPFCHPYLIFKQTNWLFLIYFKYYKNPSSPHFACEMPIAC